MTSRARMNAAMRGQVPDRIPVMCQLALGHYFLQAGLPPVDIWHDSESFATALVAMQRRYGFDGILVNLPGRDPSWRDAIAATEERENATVVQWKDGNRTIVPRDDSPRVVDAAGRKIRPVAFDDVDPDRLFYVEPHAPGGLARLAAFPPYQFDTLRRVRQLAPEVSVHGEIFSPFSQLVELLGPAEAMLALVDDEAKVKASLQRLTAGATQLAIGLLAAGADAILISSAFAGAGFISPRHYETFVLPFEARIIADVKRAVHGAIVYIHTCGAIGDRLELMQSSGTDGIDTLDPPPLGTVDLADARFRLGSHVFIKGNIDPVNTVLRGTPEQCCADALQRIAIAGPRGYILSTACSVPPRAPSENILTISRVAQESLCVA